MIVVVIGEGARWLSGTFGMNRQEEMNTEPLTTSSLFLYRDEISSSLCIVYVTT